MTVQAIAIQRIFKKFHSVPNNNLRTGLQNTTGSSQNINPQLGHTQALLETLWSQTSHLKEAYLLYLSSDIRNYYNDSVSIIEKDKQIES